MPSRARRIATTALGCWLASLSIASAARTDAIVLLNGDRLTGEVVQMRQGKLEVKTDDAGTISIEWDKIASLSTADQYELVAFDGSPHAYQIHPKWREQFAQPDRNRPEPEKQRRLTVQQK